MNKMDKKSRDLVMGKLYFKNKDYNMAETCFIEYLNSSPEDFQALKLLAQVYENMRNIPKAFELYERCFLAEPDRKGVLLDICRLLLMKDAGLSRVDQKKWLRLAIQAFPSNPIVVNLRESLPATDHKPSHRKTKESDTAVLDKLGALQKQLDQRHENLQSQIGNIEKSFENIIEKTLGGLQKRLETMDKHQESLERQIGGICEQLKTININMNKKTTTTTVAATPQTLFQTSAFDLATPLKVTQPAAPALATQFKPVVASPVTPAVATPITPAVATPITPAVATPVTPAVASPAASNTASPGAPEAVPSLVTPSLSNGFFGGSPYNFNQTGSFNNSLFTNSFAKLHDGNWGPQKTDGQAEHDNSAKNEVQAPKNTFQFSFSPKKEGTGQAESEEDGEDDERVKEVELPIENTCDMQPIQVQTGEEDEDIVFEQRCKLFRFKDKEYKERGLGNIKVLKHKETGKGRLIMRRDQIGLVCLNCWDLTRIERARDTQIRFNGTDASDQELQMNVFLAKFKTQELADTFINHLTNLFPEAQIKLS